MAANHTDSSGHFIDTLWDAYDLANDFQGCFSGNDALSCYTVPLDVFFLAVPGVPGVVDNVLRHADDVPRVTVSEAADRATRQFAEQTGMTAGVALRPRAEVWGPLEGFVRAKQAGEKNLPLIGKLPGGARIVRTSKGFPIAFRVSDVDVAFGMVRTESGWRAMIPDEIVKWNDLFNTAYGYEMAVHGDPMAGRAERIAAAMEVPLSEVSTIYFSDAPGMPFQNTTRWLYESFLGPVPPWD